MAGILYLEKNRVSSRRNLLWVLRPEKGVRDLDEIARKGEIRPGPKMTENGFDCSWWDVANAPGVPPHYTVCINEASHLPQVVRSRERGNEYTYTLSRWNQTSVGLPPELQQ